MMYLKWVLRPYLVLQYYFQKVTNTGGFGKDPAIYIKSPYEKTGNSLKDGLFTHHVKQFHESSCSTASVVSVVNTLLERQEGVNPVPVTQQDLLEKVRTAHWKERMSDQGYKGRRGLPLEILGRVVEDSLNAYKIRYRFVETIHASIDPEQRASMKQDLLRRLEQFETEGSCLIISHFDQGSFLPEFHIPHISPVGGFDPDSGKVTLLDVDPSQVHPYEVSFDRFYRGLSYDYNFMFHYFGYSGGGYVLIRV